MCSYFARYDGSLLRMPTHLLQFMMTSPNGTFSALPALCVGNSPATGVFPAQRPATRSFYVFFDLRLNKRLNKLSRRLWFEMPSRSLWRRIYVFVSYKFVPCSMLISTLLYPISSNIWPRYNSIRLSMDGFRRLNKFIFWKDNVLLVSM